MKARRVSGLDPEGPLAENARRIFATRLEELAELAPGALERGQEKTQHDMRIAAKRVRYLLEVMAPCLGPEAEDRGEAAKRLQGVLGDLHDCDVMLPRVAGLGSVETELRARRERLFDRFRELWSELEPLLVS